MFTGIIEAVGRVHTVEPRQGDLRLRIGSGVLDLSGVRIGDSIAVNGICLTVVDLPGDGFWVDVSAETVSCSLIGEWTPGQALNLERALTPTTRLGGHLVSGHVDGLGTVLSRQADGRSVRFRFEAPHALARYIASKGSICIDGTSLTVNEVSGASFGVNVVPHTLEETIMGGYEPGQRVNLEVDLIARYLERLVLGERAAQSETEGVTAELLREHGFVR